MPRRCVIKPCEVWTRGDLVRWAVMTPPCVTFMAIVGIYVINSVFSGAFLRLSLWSRRAVLFLAVALPVVLFLIRARVHIRTARRALLAGAAYGVGVALALLVILLLIYRRVVFDHVPAVVIVSAAVTGMSTALAWVAWLRVRDMTPRVHVQDGTLCPGCAYCLTGVADGRCPECARAFTHDALIAARDEQRPRRRSSRKVSAEPVREPNTSA